MRTTHFLLFLLQQRPTECRSCLSPQAVTDRASSFCINIVTKSVNKITEYYFLLANAIICTSVWVSFLSLCLKLHYFIVINVIILPSCPLTLRFPDVFLVSPFLFPFSFPLIVVILFLLLRFGNTVIRGQGGS